MNAMLLLALQLAVVLLLTFLCGWIATKLRQPRVVGEIAGGILLGPLGLGRMLPQISSLFAMNRLQWLEWVSNAGLVAFLFLIGSELDLRDARRSVGKLAMVSSGSIALPFVLGLAIAPALLRHYGMGYGSREGFILFVAIALSITALPVLARILKDREVEGRSVAAEIAQTSLMAAALNDALAWCVLATLLAVLHGGGAAVMIPRLIVLLGFTVGMLFVVRPLLRRLQAPVFVWAVLFVVLAAGSAWGTNALGIHLFFGAFLAGVCAPRSVMTAEMERGVGTLSAWTLPAFFALTGLRMQPQLFQTGGWMWMMILLAVAIVGKVAGAWLGARIAGMSHGAALKTGILLNTRGLVELIVLNAGYREGILNAAVFTLLVCMAAITTAMTGPLLDVFD